MRQHSGHPECCRYFLLIIFLGEIPEAITNYGELLARKLVDRITVSDEEIVVEIKSGLEIKAKHKEKMGINETRSRLFKISSGRFLLYV